MTAIDGKTVSGTFGKMDGQGRQPSVNKADDEHRQTVKYHIAYCLFLQSRLESHHCRKDTQRLYLDSKLTIARMYELYVENCKEFDDKYQPVSATVLFCSVLFFSRPRSECWPHHGRKCTFSIYLCPLSFWLTLSRRVLSTSWCCPSRPCVAFLACVHLALFLASSLSRQLPYFVTVWP